MSETYILVTVTHDGKVSSSAYPSQFAAENAKSIALTGVTLAAAEEYKAGSAARLAEWDADHPFRAPDGNYEAFFVREHAGQRYISRSNVGGYEVSPDYPGMIRVTAPTGLEDIPVNPSIQTAVVFKDAGDNHEALNT